MSRFARLPIALLLAALPLTGCAAALERAERPVAVVPAKLTPAEAQVLAATNAYRAERGLPPLVADGRLVDIARVRSNDMVKRKYFSHATPDGTDVFQLLRRGKVPFWAAGENLARNNAKDAPKAAMAGWIKSAGHRANLLHPSFGRLGVGVAKDAKGMVYLTQVFAD